MQHVTELVKERGDVRVRDSARGCRPGFGKLQMIAAIGVSRVPLLISLVSRMPNTAARLYCRPSGRGHVEAADQLALGVEHFVGFDVAVPDACIGGLEREPEHLRGDVEDALLDALDLEVLAQLFRFEAVLLAAKLVFEIEPIGLRTGFLRFLELGVHALKFGEFFSAFFLEVCAYALEKRSDVGAVFGHAGLEHEVSPGLVTEQLGLRGVA